MNGHWNDDPYDADDESYDEYSSYDSDDEEEVDTRPCPVCGAQVYEEAQACPSCGEWIDWSQARSASRQPAWAHSRPVWYVLLGLAGIIATIAMLSGML